MRRGTAGSQILTAAGLEFICGMGEDIEVHIGAVVALIC